MSLPFSSLGPVLLVGPADNHHHPDQAAVEAALAGHSASRARADSPVAALRWLRDNPTADLMIITPGTSPGPYVQLCRSIKFDARNAFVPVVFLLAPEAGDHAVAVFEAGADDCVQLPAPVNVIRLRLARAVRAKRATDSLEDANVVITALSTAIEGRDPYTCGHVQRVSSYAVELGRRLGVDAEGLAALGTGGVVHDIGKVVVPDQILNKPGRVTDEEMEIIRRHPVVGHDILRPLRTFQKVVPIVRWHHERPNGTGYPDGLEGDELPLLPRIVAVADLFDAVSTDRPYRPAVSPSQYGDILQRCAEKGDLDADVVAELLKMLAQGATLLAPAGPNDHSPGQPVAAMTTV